MSKNRRNRKERFLSQLNKALGQVVAKRDKLAREQALKEKDDI